MSGSGIAWLRRGCRAGDGSRWRGDVVHGALTFQHSDLLSEREDFEGGIASTAEEDTDHGEDGEDELLHELTVVTWRNRVPDLQPMLRAS